MFKAAITMNLSELLEDIQQQETIEEVVILDFK
jgi:hypothetical protein